MKKTNGVTPWIAFLLLAHLLAGCGGGGSAEVFPREVRYEGLSGNAFGYVPETGASLTRSAPSGCLPGKSACLSDLTRLTSLAQFEAFLGQLGGDAEATSAILSKASAIDFSRSQVWALKMGWQSFVMSVQLQITELADRMEIQPVICYSMGVGTGWEVRSDVFVVVPRDIPAKPVKYLDVAYVLVDPVYSVYVPVKGPRCPT